MSQKAAKRAQQLFVTDAAIKGASLQELMEQFNLSKRCVLNLLEKTLKELRERDRNRDQNLKDLIPIKPDTLTLKGDEALNGEC